MVALPAAGSFAYDAVNTHNSDMPPRFEAWLAFTRAVLGGEDEATFTIASGAITPDRASVVVDTAGGAANLDAITTTNLPLGFVLFLRSADPSRVVTVRNGRGTAAQVLTADGSDRVLTSTSMLLVLQRKSGGWRELIFWPGAATATWQSVLGMAWAQPVTGLATQAQAIAGTDAGKLVSALTLRQTLVDKGWMAALPAFTGSLDVTKWLVYDDGTNPLWRLPVLTALAGAPYQPFKAADVTLTLNDFHEFNHGLGTVPSLTKTWLVCTTAEVGYTPGMIVETPDLRAYANSTIIAWESDSTVYVNAGGAAVTPANWKARVWCWR